ncbi:TetR family transcriptional regulator [Bryobacterales bacterium F-183]|nr:TetR family transcriptional regulator [Bryobacterales bacterium F-183]
MGVTERRAREKEALRQSILDAASQLVIEQGHTNLSIRKIAEKIEYAPSTIYLYFQDRYEILMSICTDVFERLTSQLEELADRELDPIEGLRQGLRCYIRFGLEHRSHYQVTFMTPIPELPPDHPASCEDVGQAGIRCYECLRQAIQKGIDAGVFKQGDTHLMAQSVWLGIHGLVSGLICMGHDKEFPWANHEELIESQIDLLLAGMRV